MSVTFVPPLLRAPKSARVEEVSPCSDGSCVVYFEGVDTIDQAEQLVGRYCLVRKSELPSDWDLTASQVWAGFSVVDDREGDLGTVQEIMEMPGQLLLRVEGERGEILIPIVDEFVVDADYERQVVFVHVPRSLIELAGGGE